MAKKKEGEVAEGVPATVSGEKRDKRGTRFYDVVGPDGALLVRVGHYQDANVSEPTGFSRLVDFLPVFLAEVEQKGKWASFVLDSVSAASLLGRKWHQYGLNEGAKDPRQWYGGAVDLLEEVLCCQLPGMPCNVGISMHVSKEKVESEGSMVRAPLAPGRLLNMLASQWPELYRVYSETDAEGRKVRRFQTDADEKWQAGTVIEAPDGMKVLRDEAALWERVWSGWPTGEPRPPWHGILYGEFHVGKSTALARMMPRPCYVALFDAIGKDTPFRRVGKVRL